MTLDPTTLAMMRICGELEDLVAQGKLTREKFVAAFREAERVLGDGPEAEGIESITLYAEDPSWIPTD